VLGQLQQLEGVPQALRRKMGQCTSLA
jgi:hypothetical protein